MVSFSREARGRFLLMPLLFLTFILLAGPAIASAGDRLAEFKECVKVCVSRPSVTVLRRRSHHSSEPLRMKNAQLFSDLLTGE